MTPKFVPGAIYESTTHGLVEFKGIDRYMGQSTLHFYSLKYNESCYWLPDALDMHFSSAQETAGDYGECPQCQLGTAEGGRRIHRAGCPATNRREDQS